ncbi:MAG: polysaccharide deacetylase family protein [Clostridia bacterium]|nr:polysaccharide deacetylase family protein [Clostridia bacterium]
MTRFFKAVLPVAISAMLFISACDKSLNFIEKSTKGEASEPSQTQSQKASESKPEATQAENEVKKQGSAAHIDVSQVKPNEAGSIMVVMFHNFIDEYKSGDKEYTTTFDDFRKLLPKLYEKGYRLINVNDYLSNNINVPAGCIPMMFTFDDGTAGQFNLVEENGRLVANKQSAVGIMEEFNKAHPDFGLKGTFYVNLGLKTFEGKGTISERLKYLVDKGFEIGNHTYSHISLPKAKSAQEIQREVGKNQKAMLELIPDYTMTSLALPFGQASKELQEYVHKGEFEGIKYDNMAIMLVGANPAASPVSKSFNPLKTARVRASGIKPVDCDLAWWVEKLSRSEQYVSDGNPDTVTVPKSNEATVDQGKLKGKRLVTY